MLFGFQCPSKLYSFVFSAEVSKPYRFGMLWCIFIILYEYYFTLVAGPKVIFLCYFECVFSQFKALSGIHTTNTLHSFITQ